MKSQNVSLYPEEEKIREKWKKFFFFSLISCFVFMMFEFVFEGALETETPRDTAKIVADLVQFIVKSLVSLVPWFFLYLFAYKKYGTKYLMLTIIGTPLYLPVIAKAGVEMHKTFPEWTIGVPLICGMLVLYDLLYLRICWKLRKVNKAIRKRAKEVQCTDLFQSAAN